MEEDENKKLLRGKNLNKTSGRKLVWLKCSVLIAVAGRGPNMAVTKNLFVQVRHVCTSGL